MQFIIIMISVTAQVMTIKYIIIIIKIENYLQQKKKENPIQTFDVMCFPIRKLVSARMMLILQQI